jgi:hypothetical protein
VRYVFTGLVILASVLAAQQYRCDWSVVGVGGGEMSSSAYRCGATAGQTAAGSISASNYRALIGFWLPEGQVGIQEASQWPNGQGLVTRLYAPEPNPSRAAASIRYSLAAPAHASVSIHDLAGRQVRVLVNSQQKPGRYSVRWDGRDARGRSLANGIYFARFVAGDYSAAEKLVLQR